VLLFNNQSKAKVLAPPEYKKSSKGRLKQKENRIWRNLEQYFGDPVNQAQCERPPVMSAGNML